MGSNDDSGVLPERMVFSQWLTMEDIQHGTGQMTLIQSVEKIDIDQMLASGAIDDECTGWKLGKQAAVQYSAGLFRQSQQADEHIATRQKIGQGVCTVRIGNACG